MPSPVPYQDDAPPRSFGLRGNPRLYGDMSGLKGRPTSEFRARKPSASKARRMHLYLVIAACHDAGLSAKIVAEFLDITDRHVRRIYALKVKAQGKRDA